MQQHGPHHVGWLILALVTALSAHADTELPIGIFSKSSSVPADWQALTFKKIPQHTRYDVVSDGGVNVIRAQANASASGLVRNIAIDLKQYPIVQWRWKVINTVRGADPRKKSGDDYAARIYITFKYDPNKLSFGERTKYAAAKLFYGEYPPLAAISYIWDTNTPVGTVVSSAYSERLKMIVVRNGNDAVGEWRSEQRNVLQDYVKAFGEDPPPISGVAIMTDTDNTGESATAYYGDIVFLQRE